MNETTAQKHMRIYTTEKNNRAMLDSYFQDLMYYTLPRKAYITKHYNLGDKLPVDIYDSTAILANAYFAAGMQAYMSSPQTRWFSLGVKNRKFMENREVLDYLRTAEEVVYSMINGSNFYAEDVEGYLGIGSVGTDILYCEDDLEEDIRFYDLPIENIMIMNDATGRTRIIYIRYEFTAYQAAEKFGLDKLTGKILQSYKDGDYGTQYNFLFTVQARAVYDPSKKDRTNMPYMALWIDEENKRVIREGGFKDFPFYISRFAKAKTSPYGYSVAMNPFADIKMLNEMEYNNILAAQNSTRPPLEIPDEAFLKPYNFNPNGKNIKNVGFPNEHILPINTGSNLPIGMDYVTFKREGIARAFYNDLFIMTERKGQQTATEVNILNNQRMQLLGSAVGNIMRGKLSPVITKVYARASELKKLPPLPDILRGEEYLINYISPLARAQKSLELANLREAMDTIASYGAVQPQVFDKIDFDKLVDYTADITNVKPQIINDDDEVAAIREGNAQKQAAAEQMAALQQGADTIKKGAEADKIMAETGKGV